MALKPCLDCGRLSNRGTRCPGCTQARDRVTLRGKRERRPYTSAERSRRAEVVRGHVAQFGYLCPGWQCPPHPSDDLTADHPHAVAAGGDEGQSLTVLCRSCNARKRHSV